MTTALTTLEQLYDGELGSVVLQRQRRIRQHRKIVHRRCGQAVLGDGELPAGWRMKSRGTVLTFWNCWLRIADIHIHLSQQCFEM